MIMIRLLLVDDQELVCQGLQAMLNLEPDIEVVGSANNGQIAVQQVETLQPDVVLMDIRMPIMDGREATRIICQKFVDTKVLVVSTFDEDDYIAHAIKAGAKGYLLKDMPVEELAQAIRLVNRGYSQMGPGLMEKMLDGVLDSNATETELDKPELAELTAREVEVLNLVGTGCTNREIAKELYITEGTVKTHVTHILNRLNLRNRSQIAIYANSAR
jgi:DNA-binding NarL/FixJ family response regulator